jgi:hypothetical protein
MTTESFRANTLDGSKGASGSVTHPKEETVTYRDPFFSILFLGQVALVTATAVYLGPAAWKANLDNININWDAPTLLWYWTIASGAAVAASVACFWIMTRYSHAVVQLAFFAGPASAVLLASISSLYHGFSNSLPLWYSAGGVAAATSVLYYCAARYIPLAASNLHTALQALRTHSGLLGLAFCSTLFVYMWFVVWSLASLGLYDYYWQSKDHTVQRVPCRDNPRELCVAPDYEPLYISAAMLLSLFWTTQVLHNIVLTTVAGTVASWWVRRNSTSSHLQDALYRSCTTSLGSICLGSLVVAIVQVLERLVSMAAHTKKEERPDERRQHRRENGGNQLVQWPLAQLRQITEYINSWAFIYVAVYGHTYVTAGKTVATLFQKSGWSTFASDRLVYRVLGLTKVSIAVLTGALTVAAQLVVDGHDGWGRVFCGACLVGYFYCPRFRSFVSRARSGPSLCVFAKIPPVCKPVTPPCIRSCSGGGPRPIPRPGLVSNITSSIELYR